MDVAARYLELGLRIGRHVEGVVDAYFGPPELAARVAGEELRSPDALRRDAAQLREDVAADAGVDDGRRAWLEEQLLGLETYAAILAGEPVAWSDEVERCYGVHPRRVDEQVFADAHARLDSLLPGDGPLADRLDEWRTRTSVPRDSLAPVFEAVAAVLRDATASAFGLPAGETLELEFVAEKPWGAFCYYLGGRRSRIAINTDRPMAASSVVGLVAHEAYPGHHTERATKDERLVEAGVLEESIVLTGTPQCLLAEGIAEYAWASVASDETRAALVAAFAEHGIDYDVQLAEAVAEAARPLGFALVNGARLRHAEGMPPEDVQAYLERWSAMRPERAAATVAFMADPIWRAYVCTYSHGYALVRDHVAGDRAAFERLLQRQMRVADLVPLSSGVDGGRNGA